MKFSVVTPCFNGMPYLPDCIASVRHALADFDYEHVIADGGSTDGTIEFLEKQSDVDWLSEPDTGMYDALNKAITRSSGDVIGHLNSDEQYNPSGIQAALQKLEFERLDAIFGPTVMVDGKGEFLQLFKQIVTPRVIDSHWHMPVQSCSLIYRKSCWQREPYDTNYRLCADHIWFRKQMEKGLKLAPVLEPIGIFAWHAENLSSTEGKTSSESALDLVDQSTFAFKSAKHIYRLRKWLVGGYRQEPITYEQFRNGTIETKQIDKPTLKLRRDLRS